MLQTLDLTFVVEPIKQFFIMVDCAYIIEGQLRRNLKKMLYKLYNIEALSPIILVNTMRKMMKKILEQNRKHIIKCFGALASTFREG